MYPILGRYGPFFLYSYSVVMGLGILAGIGLTAWHGRRDPNSNWFDGLLVALVIGFVGGRIGFVAVNRVYFLEQPTEAWQFWRGGLSYYGALLAGLIGLLGWCRWQQHSFSTIAGILAPGFALATIFGWLACWLEGCAYGQVASHGLLVGDLPDSFGVYDLRYQTQFIAAGLSTLVFLWVLWLRRRQPPGKLLWFVLMGLSFIRVITSFFRGDEILKFNQVRVDTLVDASIALMSMVLLKYTGDEGDTLIGETVRKLGLNQIDLEDKE